MGEINANDKIIMEENRWRWKKFFYWISIERSVYHRLL